MYTDEATVYQNIQGIGYEHDWVCRSNKVYLGGDVHTNTIDGFWTHLKRGVSGVYRGVSPKDLQAYLDEYVSRYNSRMDQRGLFAAILDRIERASASENLTPPASSSELPA